MIAPLIDKLLREKSLTLQLKVTPKSSKNEIVGIADDGTLKLRITAAPEKGKANAAICEFLAALFDVPKRNVNIVRGETASVKQVNIQAR